MRYSKFLLKTQKEQPADVDSTAMSYMVRAGMVKKVSAGLFYYLPYFNMILRKVSYQLRRAMEKVNCNEMKFPILVSKETLEQSGRWNAFGKEMFKLKDRGENEFALSPTNEEYATLVAGAYVKSYNDLPFSIYQIQQKHRDEIRPRKGLCRAREFTMKDAYSFHATVADLDDYYKKMGKVYTEFFSCLGLKTVPVLADGGAMGGLYCHEYMAISNEGDADIAFCDKCGYGANLEKVEIKDTYKENMKFKGTYKEVITPDMKRIVDLVKMLQREPKDFVKSMVYNADGKLVMVLVRGDREVNESKLAFLLKAGSLELASEKEIKSIGSVMGYVGPVGELKNVRIIADYEIKAMTNFVVGGNKKNVHFIDVNNADFKCEWADLRFADENDVCPVCGGKLHISKGDELGHIFALGTRYTEKFNTKFVDTDGQMKVMQMGCYGIGLERTVASIIDQHHDEKGLILPMSIAPFKVDIIVVDTKKENQVAFAEKLYAELEDKEIPVLLDDRNERAGVKFNDFELIGVPIRITVGRGLDNNEVEVDVRKTGEKFTIKANEAVKFTASLIKKLS